VRHRELQRQDLTGAVYRVNQALVLKS
jgi:hypothetical protein